MHTLILVKHSLPEIDPETPAAEWSLSDEGRVRCMPLAVALAVHEPGVVIASREPKAAETGRIVAERLGLVYRLHNGLQEHDRCGEPFGSRVGFEERVRMLLTQPSALVMGRETADAAHARFAAAVDEITLANPSQTIAVVTHGTVISLFAARANRTDPFALWRRLGLPSFVVLALPDFRLLEVVETVL